MNIRSHFTAVLGIAAALFVNVLLAVGLPVASADDATQSLGRCIDRLNKKHKLSIGYFGGLLTAEDGASALSNASWQALTTAWFKDQFPDASIKEIGAAIDGADSLLGAFRCQTDLIRQSPDLVFVEFAVNDTGGEELRVKRSLEGIVRQIWQANPWAEIVFIYTTTKAQSSAYANGGVPEAVGYHQAIARHYGIPEIDLGRALAERIDRGDGSWEMLTSDGVHPNDAGCAFYMTLLEDFLKSHRNDSDTPPLIVMPDPLTKDPFSGAHIEDATTLLAPGWQKEEKPLGDRFPHYLASSEPGTELVHHFSGTTIGLLWLIAPDSGDIEWSIDDGKPQRLSSWEPDAANSARANYVFLADNLPSGQHTLKIKVLGEKNSRSRGTWIRIGAFLVHCDC